MSNHNKRRSVSVVLLSGGIGQRAGGGQPKQFIELNGRPVISYSLSRFCHWLDKIEKQDSQFRCGNVVVVGHADTLNETKKIINQTVPLWSNRIIVTIGGITRHGSSMNGVAAIQDCNFESVILIHDTARPYVPMADLDSLLDVFRQEQSLQIASLVTASTETLVEAENNKLKKGLDRDKVFNVKTPQALLGSLKTKFLSVTDRAEFTDLLRWAEIQNEAAQLVIGSSLNMKLTYFTDFQVMQLLLQQLELEESKKEVYGNQQ